MPAAPPAASNGKPAAAAATTVGVVRKLADAPAFSGHENGSSASSPSSSAVSPHTHAHHIPSPTASAVSVTAASITPPLSPSSPLSPGTTPLAAAAAEGKETLFSPAYALHAEEQKKLAGAAATPPGPGPAAAPERVEIKHKTGLPQRPRARKKNGVKTSGQAENAAMAAASEEEMDDDYALDEDEFDP